MYIEDKNNNNNNKSVCIFRSCIYLQYKIGSGQYLNTDKTKQSPICKHSMNKHKIINKTL